MDMKPMAEEQDDGPDDYEVQCWANKIIEAEELKQDPDKMALIEPILAAKKKAIESLPIKSMSDLKARIKKVNMAPDEEDAAEAPEAE